MDNDASSLTLLVQKCTRRPTFLHGFLYKYIVTICQRLLLLIIKFLLVPLNGFKSTDSSFTLFPEDTSEEKKKEEENISSSDLTQERLIFFFFCL